MPLVTRIAPLGFKRSSGVNLNGTGELQNSVYKNEHRTSRLQTSLARQADQRSEDTSWFGFELSTPWCMKCTLDQMEAPSHLQCLDGIYDDNRQGGGGDAREGMLLDHMYAGFQCGIR
jgi:hypothetical protein